MDINDILPITRSEVRFTRRNNGVIGYDKGEERGLSSGGRSILNGRTRYKGVDPLGYITESVYRNPIETIDVHVQEPPGLQSQRLSFEMGEPIELGEFLESEPFGVLLEERAERTRDVFERISQLYADKGMISPYEFDSINEFKGMEYRGRKAYSVSSRMPSEWSDVRLSELYLCMGMMDFDKEKFLEMNSEIMKSIGFNLKQFYKSGIMPLGKSEVPSEIVAGFTHYSYLQNFILFPLDKDHYGATVVDVSSSTDFEPGRYTEHFVKASASSFGNSILLCFLHPYKTTRAVMEIKKGSHFPEIMAFESSAIQAFEYLRSELERIGYKLPGTERDMRFYDSILKDLWEGFSSPKNRFLERRIVDDVLKRLPLEEFKERFEGLKSDVKANRKKYAPVDANPYMFISPLRIEK